MLLLDHTAKGVIFSDIFLVGCEVRPVSIRQPSNRTVFDEVELSEVSNWKAAHQNRDPTLPHGFVEWADAVSDMERRLNGDIGHPIPPAN